jgi:restriction endonuclease-like protein
MVSRERRRYWEILKSPESKLTFESLAPQAACPFRYGLYQLMRNKVLAEAMVQHGRAKWAYFGVCAHPENSSGIAEDIQEFHSLFGEGLLNIDPRVLISTVAASARRLEPWADYMRERYGL